MTPIDADHTVSFHSKKDKGSSRLFALRRDIEALESGIVACPMACQNVATWLNRLLMELIELSVYETVGPDSNEVFGTALEWLEAGRQVALATVVETSGSSPRPVGSNLVIAADGAFVGSVSGGCVESAVVSAAQDVIASGVSRILEFGYTDAETWDVGLACGGSIKVFVEPIE